jgi:hypothetical protein
MPTTFEQFFQIAGYSLAVYLMFRGACVTIHNACCWILVKFGGAEYKEKED